MIMELCAKYNESVHVRYIVVSFKTLHDRSYVVGLHAVRELTPKSIKRAFYKSKEITNHYPDEYIIYRMDIDLSNHVLELILKGKFENTVNQVVAKHVYKLLEEEASIMVINKYNKEELL